MACNGSTKNAWHFWPILYAVIPPWKKNEASFAFENAACNKPLVTLSATAIDCFFSFKLISYVVN